MKTYLFFFLTVLVGQATAQSNMTPVRRNVVSYNPTPQLLWGGKNLTLVYERLITRNQSVVVTGGYFSFPALIKADIPGTVTFGARQSSGYTAGIDYRFYLTKRNRYPAPDGLYLGPYYSRIQTKFTNELTTYQNNAPLFSGRLNGQVQINNIGVQLGYQFLFFDRLSLDLVLLGPSYAAYDFRLKLDDAVGTDEARELFTDFRQRITERYGWADELFTNTEFEQSGRLNRRLFGFRYSIRVGFAF